MIDSSEKALPEFGTGVPGAEERVVAGHQASAREHRATPWGLLGGTREAGGVRVSAKQEPGHPPFRYMKIFSHGLFFCFQDPTLAS